jgi:hypothetical protein
MTDFRTLCAELLAAYERELDETHSFDPSESELVRRAQFALTHSKQPSLKEQALAALHAVATGANNAREQYLDLDTIRRALEELP